MLFGWIAVFGQAPADSSLISGEITDLSSGQGIPFASIAVKGKLIGTQADEEGRYQLWLHQAVDSLQASAVGYQTAQRTPYAEVGYGVENIFKLARIEAMHRLTYQHNPNVTPFAVKMSFQSGL